MKELRTRKFMLKKLDAPCPDGCTEFTTKGSNYKIIMETCFVRGHGTKETRVETPAHNPEVCRTM